ncbi:MAG: type II secretion system protein [Alphaproteobacteria bacterium]|nr:type II secretion system protein [Alphaproteobacteria bacterium]
MFLYSNRTKEKGFTLVEIALVLILLGITIGAATTIISGIIKTSEIAITKQRMHKIEKKLVEHITQHGFLPCPLNEDNSRMTDAECRIDNVLQIGGIVPFDELGLLEQETKDGWGKKISYRVDPYFTQKIDPSDAATTSKACIWNWKRKNISIVPAIADRDYRPFDFRCFNDTRTGEFDSGRDYETSLKGLGIAIASQRTCANENEPCNLSGDKVSQGRPMVPYILYSEGDLEIRHARLGTGTGFPYGKLEHPNFSGLGMTYVNNRGFMASDPPGEQYLGASGGANSPFVNMPIDHNGGTDNYFGFIFKYKSIIEIVKEAGLDATNASYTLGELTPDSSPINVPSDSPEGEDVGTDDLGDGGLDEPGNTDEQTKIIETGDSSNDPIVVTKDDEDSIFVNNNNDPYYRAFWLSKPFQLQTEKNEFNGDGWGLSKRFLYHDFDTNGFVKQTHVLGAEANGATPLTTPRLINDHFDNLIFSGARPVGYGPKGIRLADTLHEGLGIPLNHFNGMLNSTPSVTFRCNVPSGDVGPVRYDAENDEYYCRYDTVINTKCEITDEENANCENKLINTRTHLGTTFKRGHKIRAYAAFALEGNSDSRTSNFNGLALAFTPYMGVGDPRQAPATDHGDMDSQLVGAVPVGYHSLWTPAKLANTDLADYAKNAGFYGHGSSDWDNTVKMQRKFGVGIMTPQGSPNQFKILRWENNELNTAYEKVPLPILLAYEHNGRYIVGRNHGAQYHRVYVYDPPSDLWRYVAKEWNRIDPGVLYKGCTSGNHPSDIIGTYNDIVNVAYRANGDRWGTVDGSVSGEFGTASCNGVTHATPLAALNPPVVVDSEFRYDNPAIVDASNGYPAGRLKYDAACKEASSINPSEEELYEGCYQEGSEEWLQNTDKDAWENETNPICLDAKCYEKATIYQTEKCRSCMSAFSEDASDLRACNQDCAEVISCITDCTPPAEEKYFHKMIVHVYANPNDPLPFERNDCHITTPETDFWSGDRPLIHRVRVKAWLWETGYSIGGNGHALSGCTDAESSACTNISDYAYIFDDDDGNSDGIKEFNIKGLDVKLKSSIMPDDLANAKVITGCVEVPATWMNIGLTMGSQGFGLAEVKYGINWIPSPNDAAELPYEKVP